jgi:transposase
VKLKGKHKKQQRRRERIVVNVHKLHTILDKSRQEALNEAEYLELKTSIDVMAARLAPRTSEKKDALLASASTGDGAGAGGDNQDSNTDGEATPEKKPRPGHGRNGVDKYPGATFITVGHSTLQHKDACPGCVNGHVYDLNDPRLILRVVAVAPFQATVHELQRLRCSLCGELFTAEAPEGIGDEKFDASVASMVAQLKYGSGMPWYRIEKLQAQMGVPLPSGTQCDLVKKAAKAMEPVHEELNRLAAQGEVLNHDDTGVRILDAVERPADQDQDRTGLHTTGIVSKLGEHLIALFKTGPKHAGENMGDLLSLRLANLAAPILMSDALAANKPKLKRGLELLLANCLTHGRRQFVDIFDSFPDQCQYVILELSLVYFYDEQARELGLDPDQRLAFHQQHSKPVMDRLKKWLDTQLTNEAENRVEPNSGLGKAINYLRNHWEKLTLFLRHPGAPVDNNIAERALKRVVLHRKNALFFKTQRGAQMGDLYMSLIHTCELNGINAFQYMTDLQRHAAEVKANPSVWLPWNYHLQLRSAPS